MIGILHLSILLILFSMNGLQNCALAVSLQSASQLSEYPIFSKKHPDKGCPLCAVSLTNHSNNPAKREIHAIKPRSIVLTTSQNVDHVTNTDEIQSSYVTITGHSVHLECIRNNDGRQEPPCILQMPDTAFTHKQQRYMNGKGRSSKPEENLKEFTFESGDFAYLPCRTLGVGKEDTTIWEKGDNPLFASKTKFSKNDRIHLLTDDEKANDSSSATINADRHQDQRVVLDEQYRYEKDHISQWNLVINFLQPDDSDIYTCRLVGRTQQLIRYRIHVTESKPLMIYSSKRIVTMTVPKLVNLAHPFNLTCSVHLGSTNSAYITVDWFRPDQSYDELKQYVSLSSKGAGTPAAMHIQSNQDHGTSNHVTATISWFAQSFSQLISQPNFGTNVFKQLRTEKESTYKSEAVYTVQKASPFEEGFYECRAYEPVNYGHERILDRAITAVVVNRPYPQKPTKNEKWRENFAYLLASHWNLLSESELRQHDQSTQNDGGSKVIDWLYPAPRLKPETDSVNDLKKIAKGATVRRRVDKELNSVSNTQCCKTCILFFVILQNNFYFFTRQLWFTI